jgi:L-cysteine:1D-myo-inositol 2-amino-2-deoxy-alpha-D-glucopyranoside ligase
LWRTGTTVAAGPDGQAVLTRVRDYLAQDLRTPEILDAIDEWARAAVDGVGNDSSAPQLIQDLVDALLGVRLVKG